MNRVAERTGSKPEVSVLMTVYNGTEFLTQAVESILGQTLADFEFVIVNDGSTDDTAKILARYADPRLRVVSSGHLGLVGALNLGLKLCRADLIARMDADDEALPDRLEYEARYLREHPDVDVVCSDIYTINSRGEQVGREVMFGLGNDALRESLLYRRVIKPIVHPTVMMRKQVPEALSGYREFRHAEDHDFWLRAVDQFTIRRVNHFTLRYRRHANGVSRSNALSQIVSGCMSAVDYCVRTAGGGELYQGQPELFRRLRDHATVRVEREIMPAFIAFSEARESIRAGKRALGVWRLANAFLQHGRKVQPHSLSLIKSQLVDELTTQAMHELTAATPEMAGQVTN